LVVRLVHGGPFGLVEWRSNHNLPGRDGRSSGQIHGRRDITSAMLVGFTLGIPGPMAWERGYPGYSRMEAWCGRVVIPRSREGKLAWAIIAGSPMGSFARRGGRQFSEIFRARDSRIAGVLFGVPPGYPPPVAGCCHSLHALAPRPALTRRPSPSGWLRARTHDRARHARTRGQGRTIGPWASGKLNSWGCLFSIGDLFLDYFLR
jgi:hypothetical protein